MYPIGTRVVRTVYRCDAKKHGTVVGFSHQGWPMVVWDGTKTRHAIHPDVLDRWREAETA